MNKTIKLVLSAGVSLILAFVIYYYWPKTMTITMPGVLYQLGEENYNHEIQTTIVIDGIYDRNLFIPSTFEGKIEVLDDSVYAINDDLTLSIDFFSQLNNSTKLAPLAYFDSPDFRFTTYGSLYVDQGFSQLAIIKHTNHESGGSGWNGWDGYMFAAPAYTREEAVKISRQLIDLEGIKW